MKIKKKNRKFYPSVNSKILLKDCGEITLKNDEQVTFVNRYKKNQYDIVKKAWGYYATPSINSRLKKNNFDAHIVQNNLTKNFFIFLVERKKKSVFTKYLKKENLEIVGWPKKLLKKKI
tara:strand:- start:409 stop:765 length:357 start_codon:yes stop_codon:yes gene_type:complete